MQPIRPRHAAMVGVEVTPMVVTAFTPMLAMAFTYMVAPGTTITGKLHQQRKSKTSLFFIQEIKLMVKVVGRQTLMHLVDGMTIVNLRTTTLKIGEDLCQHLKYLYLLH